MAISLSAHRRASAKMKASEDIAKQQKKAQDAEDKRKGRSKLFGSISGALLGAAAVGLTGLTGGLAAPLVLGVASSLGKKWTDEASRGASPFGKLLKSSGQVDKITSSSPYGRKLAEEATKDLEAQRKTNWSAESMLGDIASSYVTAGLSGGLTGATKGLVKGELSLKEALTTGSKDAWKFGGMEGAKEGVLGLLPEGKEIDPREAMHEPDDFLFDAGESAGYAHPSTYQPSLAEDALTASGENRVNILDVLQAQGQGDTGQSYETNFEHGGQVMDQNTLVGLAILSEMSNQEKAYDNTPLEEKQPTISEVFASKGKTLGGSNTKSLSQMLGV